MAASPPTAFCACGLQCREVGALADKQTEDSTQVAVDAPRASEKQFLFPPPSSWLLSPERRVGNQNQNLPRQPAPGSNRPALRGGCGSVSPKAAHGSFVGPLRAVCLKGVVRERKTVDDNEHSPEAFACLWSVLHLKAL
ncbi:hypothetical protein P7K49_006005 [Saguinus oedipus]|uniref:Uncharacterized protein n=1 Tax=Saguinus oedipus TaxID=9490 RepID=A0ABQ9W162_SAGOE|nr:hypothetical protein P7K49_006005 [Saguinus oedipus]